MIHSIIKTAALTGLLPIVAAGVIDPQKPIPGQYEPYNTHRGPDPPAPGGQKGAILPTSDAEPLEDDALFQTLMTAEWYVSSFYNHAVQQFNETSFTALGFPNNTYDRIQEIRDNEFGHVQLFMDARTPHISDASVKPGPCEYNIKFDSPFEFLVQQIITEATGAAFLPGMVANAKARNNQASLAALSQIETRHATWATIDVWGTNPFSGPVDTVYAYPLQILSLLQYNIIPGSCPKENPPFPNPPSAVGGALMQYNRETSQGKPGQDIQFTFPAPQSQPKFEDGKEYYAVFFHGLDNITIPFDTTTCMVKIPDAFDKEKGVIVAVVADQPGAVVEESVVGGPLLLLQQPDPSVLAKPPMA